MYVVIFPTQLTIVLLNVGILWIFHQVKEKSNITPNVLKASFIKQEAKGK